MSTANSQQARKILQAEPSAPATQLCPNRADINKHLYALFDPNFVMAYPDAWIEIAYANPAAGGGLRAAEQFSAFQLEAAGDFAEAKNKRGFNIYVGVALRQGETPATSNGRASGENVLTACRAWTDFDGEGDAERVEAILKDEAHPAGGSGHHRDDTAFRRFQVHFELAAKPSEDGLDPGNPTPAELTAVNTALRDLAWRRRRPERRSRDAAGGHRRPIRRPAKVERGYVPELVTLRVIDHSRAYSVAELIELATGAADPSREYGQASSRDGRSKSYKSGSGKPQAGETRTKPRSDAELEALLKTSQIAGKWWVSIRSATATMIGRGMTDAEIRAACAPYCTGGFDDSDIDDFLDRGRAKWNVPDGASIERLARLTRVKYEQQRKAAAKELGMRVSVLDNLVGQHARGRGAEEDVDDQIAELNAEYALVLAGNKAAVMKFEDATKFRLLQVGAFKQWFANQLVTVGKEIVSLGDYWLGHPERRQYAGIEFAPPGIAATPGYYNLWQGFAVEPKQGDCSKFLAHLKDNVARGDEATYLWIVGWWAQIVQQPSIKMETALVLRGPFGAGKTKIGEVFGSLIGDALPAGRLTALHHRPIQLAHGVAAGAARRRGVLGRRQGERRHAEGSGVGQESHARVQGHRSDRDQELHPAVRDRQPRLDGACRVSGTGAGRSSTWARTTCRTTPTSPRSTTRWTMAAARRCCITCSTSISRRSTCGRFRRPRRCWTSRSESMTPEQAWWFETLMQGRAAAEAAGHQRAARLSEG